MISPKEQEKLRNDYGWATSKLATKMIPTIRNAYGSVELVDLLMALPLKFEFSEIDKSTLPDDVSPEDAAFGGYITRDTERGNPDRLVVHIILTKEKEQTWEDFFKMIFDVNPQKYIALASVVYLHEALHILMRHYDFYQHQNNLGIIKNIRNDMSEEEMAQLLNHAHDYWINAYLLEQAASNTRIARFKDNDVAEFTGLYDPNLAPGKMEQQEIIVKLAKEADVKKTELFDAEGNLWGTMTEITINGRTSRTLSVNGQHAIRHDGSRPAEGQQQEIDEVLDSTRNNILERTKGEGSTGTLKELGVDYAVPIDWFKHLKSSLFNVVQKYTSTYDQTWSKLKNKFRHIAPMPGKIHYEKELAAIISIDQSGSMSDEDLEKINYVVSELAKKAVFTEVLLHDTSVAERKRFTGKKPLAMREFITNRVACGGTSHKEVFGIVREIKDEDTRRKLIYLSFSDNWSDIEQVYDADLFDKVTAYWITTDENRTVNVPGMQISLENGLLRE